MFSRILLASDGSPTSRAVSPYVSWLARSVGAGVIVIRATPDRGAILRAVALDLDADDLGGSSFRYPDASRLDEVGAWLRSRAEQAVEREAVALRQQGVAVSVRVVEGDPAEVIAGQDDQAEDTLIAMATHGRSGVERWFVGGVTAKVVRESRTPVLALRPHEGTDPPAESDGIVVPLDGSQRAEAALPLAEELAVKLGLPLTLVRSVSLSGLGYGFVEDGPTQYADLAGSAERIATDYLALIAEGVRAQGVREVVELVADRSPDDAIMDVAGGDGMKLVVMTTHGRTGLNRMVLGSVTDRVLRRGSGPVLIVPSLNP